MSEPKSNKFMLSVATVMIGPQADLHGLNPTDHSVGLVKNFTCESTKDRTDLTAGRTNDIVFTATTGVETRATFEMYEYSVTNLNYALGLDGDGIVVDNGTPFTNTVNDAGTAGLFTVTSAVPSTPQTYSVNDSVMIRLPDDNNILIGVVSDVTGQGTGTIDVQVDASFTGALAVGAVVSKMNVLDVGSSEGDTDYSAKVSGQLADGTWVTYLFPKIRVTSGLSLAFTTDSFNNIPFEFLPLKLIPGEDFYADFKGKQAKLLIDTAVSTLE